MFWILAHASGDRTLPQNIITIGQASGVDVANADKHCLLRLISDG